MKRILCFFLALLAALSLTPGVRADVIFEPEDSFYRDHRDECTPHERSYYAAGPDGTVTVYRSPESAAVEARVEDGEVLWISHVYEGTDGIAWGYCENFVEEWSGWVPMDHLLLKYDHQSFAEEYRDRIEGRSGTLAPSAGGVYFWDYPGSEGISASLVLEEEYLPEYQAVFTDDAGREWGYVGYYMGIRNVWVCLDDPTADYDTLYAEHPPQQVTHPVKDTSAEPIEIKPGGPDLTAVLLSVAAVAAVSGIFLWRTRRKDER